MNYNIQSISSHLSRLEETLNHPLSTKEFQKVSHELNLMERFLPQGPFAGFLGKKYKDLCGKVEMNYFAGRIISIEDRAKHLKNTQEAEKLLEEVNDLSHDYRGSLEENKKLSSAKKAIDRVLHPSVQNHFDFLSEQTSSLDLCYEDFLEIGELIYQGNILEAKSRFRRLPPSLKRMIDSPSLFTDRTGSLQACIAAAHQTLGNDDAYPTPEEAVEFFEQALTT